MPESITYAKIGEVGRGSHDHGGVRVRGNRVGINENETDRDLAGRRS